MRLLFNASTALLLSALTLTAASQDRITGPIDGNRVRAIPGSVHRMARQAQYDRGVAAPDLQLDHVLVFIKPSPAQQTALDQLLQEQQNPASANYHKWLTPEAYADRFGLSPRDQSKIAGWLKSAGLTAQESARGRNWISFKGSAAQISQALHTSIHTYLVKGHQYFANSSDPSVPEAIADLVSGFAGLNNFRPLFTPPVIGPVADYTSNSGSHALSPGDLATIYDIKPLYAAGIDGTGQRIAIVGVSDIALSDLRGFRSTFGLPAQDPQQVLYGVDPGFNDAQFEANIDLEWSAAIAQRATIYYVYGQNFAVAWAFAVDLNLAPVISMSFGGCETDNPTASYQAIAQQANAQGITNLASSGDSGGGGCDIQGVLPVVTHGSAIGFPADIPEVTAVGGTMFSEGTGSYWNPVNSLTAGTALSYIPEAVWNESSLGGVDASAGGPSQIFTKPAWQNAPGVPADGARDIPDVSLAAAFIHDGYLVEYNGSLYSTGGTSAASPSFGGIVALLNQYAVKQGIQKTAGLGNINPQLYRLSQVAPAAFHDITMGSNMVPCEQGTPGCLTGSVGHNAAPGYDLATGLGSVDANVLLSSWNTAASPAILTVTSNASKITLNDTFTVTATVASGNGKGTPSGSVSFLAFGTPLGSVALAPAGNSVAAVFTVPAWMLGKGTVSVYAEYSGDAMFSGAGASVRIQVTLPTSAGISAVIAAVNPNPVFAFQMGTEAPTWQTNIALSELAGVPALLTGFTLDGQTEPLAQYFPSANIPAGGTLKSTIILRNLAVPAAHVLGFTGTDAGGNSWSRQVSVQFVGAYNEGINGFNLWLTPLTVQQNTAAPAACQWSQAITIDGAGYAQTIVGLLRGSVDLSSSIPSVFGTTRLAPWSSLQGTVCWSNVTPPATDFVIVETQDDFGDLFQQNVNVTFAGPPTSAIQLSASPVSLNLKPASVPGFGGAVTLNVSLSDKTQPWTAAVYPADETTSWLQLSQYSGTGPAAITLQALPAGFEPGAYKATIVVQSPLATPEWVSIPVMWVNSGSPSGLSITSAVNAFSFTPGASPGMLMAVFGTQLANGVSLTGVSATVNGWPAPVLYASPTQLNIQVPFETGAGPAVLGINNNGQIGGFMFPVAPSSPGIVSVNGSISPSATAKQGAYATLYVTGVGDVSPAVQTGVPVAPGTPPASLPLPMLPLSVSVGGTPALVQFAGFTPGLLGLAQVNFLVPTGLGAGIQPVVVTVNGVASAPVNITVITGP